MKILDLPQGGKEWLEARRKYATASEMPAILKVKGAYGSRKKFLESKASGIEKPVSPMTQAIFDRGHAVEIELRAWCQIELGMEFKPAVVVNERYGILASIDCYNQEYGVIVETKNSTSETKLELARSNQVCEPYRVQVVTQMLVAKSKVAFLCMRDDSEGINYLIPVERDAILEKKIKKEAKLFLKELKSVK